MFNLALLYENHYKEYEKAIKWYEKAIKKIMKMLCIT
jgi:TPR repeat protein